MNQDMFGTDLNKTEEIALIPASLADLQEQAEKLKEEGRMPSPEVFDKVMERARIVYKKWSRKRCLKI